MCQVHYWAHKDEKDSVAALKGPTSSCEGHVKRTFQPHEVGAMRMICPGHRGPGSGSGTHIWAVLPASRGETSPDTDPRKQPIPDISNHEIEGKYSFLKAPIFRKYLSPVSPGEPSALGNPTQEAVGSNAHYTQAPTTSPGSLPVPGPPPLHQKAHLPELVWANY